MLKKKEINEIMDNTLCCAMNKVEDMLEDYEKLVFLRKRTPKEVLHDVHNELNNLRGELLQE